MLFRRVSDESCELQLGEVCEKVDWTRSQRQRSVRGEWNLFSDDKLVHS